MKPGYVQTNDLVRFQVANVRGIFEPLHIFGAGRWIWQDAGDNTVIRFVCTKADVPRVLDILEKHGIARVEELT